ncbi:Clp protease ClpP [Pseudoduganella eburnea]|uniref:Clp protease ClpP n=1 Tax=Massilia eburnea TaxID=1776165 RepID=A0A6L6QD93_9BURK|nr:Clp protease ClpP [Massilia eburnea]MTW10024.1 Clp protease ClpP [Massilia eburnea]
MNNQFDPDEAGDERPMPEPFTGLQRFERRTELRQVSFYISGLIEHAALYNDLFYTLRSASDTDLIYLHLNTTGGDFDTGLQIINNMRASAAHVVTVLEARAYSMGAFLFLAGDELLVHDNCQLLFHSYSGFFTGKGSEQQAQAAAVANWFAKFMERSCQPFLTEREIKSILKGSDVWMDSDEIRRRLLRMARPVRPTVSRSRKRLALPDGGLQGESGMSQEAGDGCQGYSAS